MRKIITVGIDVVAGTFTVRAFALLAPPKKRGWRGKQTSRVPLASTDVPWGLTPEEAAAFEKGGLTEVAIQAGPFVIATATRKNVRDALEALWDAEQAKIDASGVDGPDVVGDSWDGTTWSAAAAAANVVAGK